MMMVPDLSMLSGNMFACRLDGRDLPTQDPSHHTYMCGSDEVNIALGVRLSSFAVVVLVVALQLGRLSRRSSKYVYLAYTSLLDLSRVED
eukprot:gene18664-13440_t